MKNNKKMIPSRSTAPEGDNIRRIKTARRRLRTVGSYAHGAVRGFGARNSNSCRSRAGQPREAAADPELEK
jgi:hypothetical protein